MEWEWCTTQGSCASYAQRCRASRACAEKDRPRIVESLRKQIGVPLNHGMRVIKLNGFPSSAAASPTPSWHCLALV
jgi:hypothetical protein